MTTDLQQPPTRPEGARPGASRPAPTVGEASRRVTPVILGLLLVVAGLAGAGFLWSDALATVDESTTTHPAVEQVVLDLHTNGDVEVRVHDADEIVVQQRVERTISEIDVEQRVVDGRLELTSGRCGSWFSMPFIRCSASFVVTVPASTSVAGELDHGRIVLAGLDGGADVRTGHGHIEATDVAGPLTLGTGHGQVSVTGAGDAVRVETGHGSILLSDVAGPAEASTGHGGVEVADVDGDLVVETGHGTVDVAGTAGEVVRLSTGHGTIAFVPGSAPATAELSTGHGDVSVALPSGAPPYAVTADASDETADIEVATDPGADHRLHLQTGQGRIDVAYAAR